MRGINIPDFELVEIEEFYTYYVQIMNIPDEMFWNADIKFLDKVVNQKAAYDKWLSKAMQKESER